MAVAGTHGKTTTAGMLAWILEDCGYQPGFLIGGVPGNFQVSAQLGESPFLLLKLMSMTVLSLINVLNLFITRHVRLS